MQLVWFQLKVSVCHRLRTFDLRRKLTQKAEGKEYNQIYLHFTCLPITL